jgi:hypothetical protein
LTANPFLPPMARNTVIGCLAVAGLAYGLTNYYRRSFMSSREETASALVIQGVSEDWGAREGETVDKLLEKFAKAPKRSPRRRGLRTRIVVRAIQAIRAEVGFMKESPANALVVAHKFRKWAGPDGVGMRLSHIDEVAPHVVAWYFIPTSSELEVAQIKASHAYYSVTSCAPRASASALMHKVFFGRPVSAPLQ